jgi:hypothetical protein
MPALCASASHGHAATWTSPLFDPSLHGRADGAFRSHGFSPWHTALSSRSASSGAATAAACPSSSPSPTTTPLSICSHPFQYGRDHYSTSPPPRPCLSRRSPVQCPEADGGDDRGTRASCHAACARGSRTCPSARGSRTSMPPRPSCSCSSPRTG